MRLFVPAPVGRLEAILTAPKKCPREWAVVLCHPHPQFGGTMHTKAIFRSARALQALGMATLQFNFRGVGQSAGNYDDGRGEKDDTRAAIDFLARRFPDAQLAVLGFSFGSWVGLQVAAMDERIVQLIGLGVPLQNTSFSFLSPCVKPKLIIQGSRDEFAPRPLVEEWFSTLAEPKDLVFIEGSTHLFEQWIAELQQALIRYFENRYGMRVLNPL